MQTQKKGTAAPPKSAATKITGKVQQPPKLTEKKKAPKKGYALTMSVTPPSLSKRGIDEGDGDAYWGWDGNDYPKPVPTSKPIPPSMKPHLASGEPFGDLPTTDDNEREIEEYLEDLRVNGKFYPLHHIGMGQNYVYDALDKVLAGVAGARDWLHGRTTTLPKGTQRQIRKLLDEGNHSQVAGLVRMLPQSLALSSQITGGRTASIHGIEHTEYGPGLSSYFKLPIGSLRNQLGVLGVTTFGSAVWDTNTLLLGPDSMGGRMAVFASLFARWKIKHLQIIYSPGCPATTAGTLAWGIMDDPAGAITPFANLEGIMQLSPSEMSSVWSPMTIVSPYRKDWFYSDATTGDGPDERRLTDCGRLVLAAAGLDNTPTNQYLGTIELCAELEYAGPTPNTGITLAALLRRQMGAENFAKFMTVLSDRDNLCKALQSVGLSNTEVQLSNLLLVNESTKLGESIRKLKKK